MNGATEQQKEPESTGHDHFLLFRLGNELYGTELLSVREVLEPQKPKPIPQTTRSFLGVVNIRGEIIGVLDLRLRFDYPAGESPRMAMLVFSANGAPLAALVDQMEGVARIPNDKIDRGARIEARMPLKYVTGIGQHKGQLVTLVDFRALFDQEELSQLQGTLLRASVA